MRTTRIVSLLLFLIVPLFVAGCSRPKGGVGNQYLQRLGVYTYQFDPAIEELTPEVVVNRHSPERVYFGILATANDPEGKEMAAVQSITSVSFVVLNDDGEIIDSLYTEEVSLSGINTGVTSTVASAGVNWKPEVVPTEKFTLVSIIRTFEDGIWVRQAATTLPELLDYDPVTLDLDILPDGKGLLFKVKAVRHIASGETEYLPSSEEIRITIYDGPVKLWSSNDGVAFTNAVEKVNPEDVGDEEEWEIEWDGNGLDGKRVPGGLYTIEAMIPARPNAYYVRKDYRWAGM